MNKKLISLYGLKWNPFIAELPQEALVPTMKTNQFCWRVENLVAHGGFALITGAPGLGKSVAFRLLASRLDQMGDINVAEFTRPQSGISDFYRELGKIFGIQFRHGNRYRGYQGLRDTWTAHINSTLYRPVLLIDESQQMSMDVLSELRLLASTCFDSKILLTVVLGGDARLLSKLEYEELLPLKRRIRTRLALEDWSCQELVEFLVEALDRAGNGSLMTKGLIDTVAEHATGNPGAMMAMCGELLVEASQKEIKQIDEGFFISLFSPKTANRRKQ
jgi:general secretion pathway protein A